MVVALILMPQVASVGVLVDSDLGPPEVVIPEFVFCAVECDDSLSMRPLNL